MKTLTKRCLISAAIFAVPGVIFILLSVVFPFCLFAPAFIGWGLGLLILAPVGALDTYFKFRGVK